MKIHLITIGDEILIGQTLNTNAAFIGEKLTDIQAKVISTTVVGDSREAIISAVDNAFNSEAEMILLTGGLGPTHDDITKKCLVEYFETTYVKDEETLQNIKAIFARRGREVTQANQDQALVPECATILKNSEGTAPGLWFEKNNKILVSMPGVPFEMKSILTNEVIPRIIEIRPPKNECIKIKNILTTGIPESTLFERIGDIEEFSGHTKMAFLPNQYGVKLRLTTKGKDESEALNNQTEVEQRIRALAGRYIFGTNDENIEDVVGRLLIDRDLTISVAESCTGGLISARLTDVSGSSSYFERAMVTYSNGAKVEHLQVDEDFIHQYGAVSLEVARQMAEGVRAISGTDIGIAASGIMGPTGDTPGKPVGLVYIGLCDEKICTAKEFRFNGTRKRNKERTSQAALEMLRRHLLGIPYDE